MEFTFNDRAEAGRITLDLTQEQIVEHLEKVLPPFSPKSRPESAIHTNIEGRSVSFNLRRLDAESVTILSVTSTDRFAR